MVINVSILSFSVLRHVISIKLTSPNNHSENIEEIKHLKGHLQKYIIEVEHSRKNRKEDNKDTTPCPKQYIAVDKKENTDSKRIELRAKIQSLNIRNNLNFVLHTKKYNFLVYKIMEMIDMKLIMKFISHKERKLQELLSKVAEILNLPDEEALYKFTTFKNKKTGKTIQGKRSIYELSEKHKTVVIDKLRRMLDSNRSL